MGTYNNLLATINNIIEEAKLLGLTELKPVNLKILANDFQGQLKPFEVHVIVSHVQPVLPSNSERLWLNVSSKSLHINDGSWTKLVDYNAMVEAYKQ